MESKRIKIMRYGIGFLLIALLCWLFPYTGDDWAWGSRIGLDRLDVWFYDYNGRYAGNLLVLAMTRSNLVKTLVMAFCLIGIAYLAEYISKCKWAFYVSCVALILMPKLILRQAVVWTAGYSNYVVSLFLSLIFIAYAYPIFEDRLSKRKLWHGIPLLVLGFVSALFVEHLTIYNVVLGIGVIVYTIVVHRHIVLSHLAYLAGAAAGAVVMFSNGAYHNIANKQDEYRQMAEGGVVTRAVENYVQEIAKHLCLNNVWVNLAILIVCFLLYRQCMTAWKNKKEQCMAGVCLIVMTGFNVWALLSSFGIATYAKQNRLLYIEALLVALYMLALIGFCVLVGIRQKCLWKLMYWNAGIVCVAAPLLVVNPIGERCFFATYILFVMLLIELGSRLTADSVREILGGRTFRNVCLCISLAGLAFYLNIFSSIAQVDHERLAYIERQVAKGKTTVEIRHLPYESYLWTSTPEFEPWTERYKLFYGLPEDLEIKAVWEYSRKKK